jgi:nitrogen-specific signal transduction histidine kinase
MPQDDSRTSELRLRAAVESSPSGLPMVDARGRIVLVNREIERMFGCDLEELIAFTHRGKSLVQKIQAFGRRHEGERVPLSLGRPVQEVESFLRSSLPPTIEITTVVHPETPRVLADLSAIHQVIMNLGMNAGQAMETGGRLSIEVLPL